jgi:hypothetical protein
VTLGIKTKGGVRGKEGGGPSAGAALSQDLPWDFFAEIFNIFGIADIFVIRAL